MPHHFSWNFAGRRPIPTDDVRRTVCPTVINCMLVTPRTLYQVLDETARVHGDAPALRQPAPDGSYLVYSWNQYRRAAEESAAGLRTLGIAKGDVVALNSETRLEFYLADLGILTNGSIAAAMYPNYPAPDLVRTIQSAGARAVFVEDPKTLQPLRGAPAAHWIPLTHRKTTR